MKDLFLHSFIPSFLREGFIYEGFIYEGLIYEGFIYEGFIYESFISEDLFENVGFWDWSILTCWYKNQ